MKESAKLGIRLEHDPSADRQYRVIADDEVIYATNVESSALSEYDEVFAERDVPFAERRKRELDFQMGASMQAERVARTSNKAAKTTGGYGGRGGV